jgi:hypothetical protein
LLLQDIEFNNLKRIDLRKSESITKFPNLCAPNLEKLDLSFCRNLVGFHESIGSLEKLREWKLTGCQKLQNLPSNLMLKSLHILDISLCESLEDFPSSHGFNILRGINRYRCKSLIDLPGSIYKLQLPQGLYISSKTWRSSIRFPYSFKEYVFAWLEVLDMSEVGNLIELDFLMKPDYFPVLKYLCLNEINIITIPESISKFTRLNRLEIKNCKYLREIPRLPQSLRHAVIMNCQSLDPISSNRLLSQVFLSPPILLKQFFYFLKNTLLDLF